MNKNTATALVSIFAYVSANLCNILVQLHNWENLIRCQDRMDREYRFTRCEEDY